MGWASSRPHCLEDGRSGFCKEIFEPRLRRTLHACGEPTFPRCGVCCACNTLCVEASTVVSTERDKTKMQSTITALRARVRSLGAAGPAADGKNIVAFSGGVDSSLVAALVHHVFPGSSQACVGVSSALPAAQLSLARSVASHIGERARPGVCALDMLEMAWAYHVGDVKYVVVFGTLLC